MSTYVVGDTFTNGFFVIETPTTPFNNTGEYRVSNSVGTQYYVTGAGLDSYDLVGNYNNGNGGTGGSTGSGTNNGGGTIDLDALPGSDFVTMPASTSGTYVVSTASGSMVRLVNLSDLPQAAIVLGFDNASTTSGPLLFAQQLDAQQVVDINVRTYHGITLSILNGPTNVDWGINVVNDTGGNADVTGYPFVAVPPNASTSVAIITGVGTCIGLRNNSQTNQSATLVGYDNPSTTTGRILFREQLGPGQSVNIRENFSYGITVGIENGPTNSDYGVNVLYATSS